MNEQEIKRKQILTDVVSAFGRQEWFRDAVMYDNHEQVGGPTLEFKVNYIPIFEKKDVIAFAQNKNLNYYFTVIDKFGNKIE